MRDIKFRGICKDTGKWIYSNGFLKHKDGTIILISEEREDDLITSPIKEKTLAQYTGLRDKNRKEIYEGDIVETTFYLHSQPNLKLIQIVKFEKGCFVLNPLAYNTELEFETTYQYTYLHVADKINVIDNIHENKNNFTIIRG